jgi:histidine triad (HIT) family protein
MPSTTWCGRVAIAIRSTYCCDGVSTRQHNEPDGNQDAWHHHVHVFPRYRDDNLYASAPEPTFMPAEQRWSYAERLRVFMGDHASRARPLS